MNTFYRLPWLWLWLAGLLTLALPGRSQTIVGLTPARNAITLGSALTVNLSAVPTPAAAQQISVFGSQTGRRAGTATVTGTGLGWVASQAFRAGEAVQVTVPRAVAMPPQVYQFMAAAPGGTGRFSAAPTVPAGAWVVGLTTADVDLDGDVDLLTANQSAGTVSVRLNNGQGIFTGGSNVNVVTGPRSVTMADVDNDGDPDMLAANILGSTVALRLNDGAGNFTLPAGGATGTIAVGSGPVYIGAADVDADGDLDLLVANYNSNTVSIRLNNGSGVFTAPASGATVPVGGGPNTLAAADVDGDGDLDLLTASNQGNTVSVRLNNGAGVFATPVGAAGSVAVGTTPAGLALADLDGDGDVDLLTANQGSSTVSVCLNNGAGIFAASAGAAGTVAVGANPLTVGVADFDGDGDLDFFTANYGSSNVSVRANNGRGQFSVPAAPAPAMLSTSSAIYAAVAADVDNDGDPDLLTADSFANTASVLLNQNAYALAATGPAVACAGSQVTLVAALTPALATATYQWNFGDPGSGANNTATGSAATHVYATAGTYQAVLTAQLPGIGTALTTTRTVTVAPRPAVSLGGNRSRLWCPGSSLLLVATPQPAGSTYRWQDGSTNATYAVQAAGRYVLRVTSPQGCAAADSVEVVAAPLPVAGLPADTVLCPDAPVWLRLAAQPAGTTFRWQDGSTAPQLLASAPGQYVVELTNPAGCSSRATVQVRTGTCPVIIPTIITPNGDGLNEAFVLQGLRATDWTLQLYNRWGRQVHQQAHYDGTWAADGQSAGLYYYLLTNPATGQRYQGWVEVVR